MYTNRKGYVAFNLNSCIESILKDFSKLWTGRYTVKMEVHQMWCKIDMLDKH